jgi:hypothetical protein
MYPFTDISQPILNKRMLPVSVFIHADFEPERLLHKVRSRQHLGSRRQHRISFDTDCGIEVSGHDLHAFITFAGTHPSYDSWNSHPLCHYSLVIAPSIRYLFSSISVWFFFLLFFVICTSMFDVWRQDVFSGFFPGIRR